MEAVDNGQQQDEVQHLPSMVSVNSRDLPSNKENHNSVKKTMLYGQRSKNKFIWKPNLEHQALQREAFKSIKRNNPDHF